MNLRSIRACVLLIGLIIAAVAFAVPLVAQVATPDPPAGQEGVFDALAKALTGKVAMIAPAWLVLIAIPLAQPVKLLAERAWGSPLGDTAGGRIVIGVMAIAAAALADLAGKVATGEAVGWPILIRAVEAGGAAYLIYKPLFAGTKPALPSPQS